MLVLKLILEVAKPSRISSVTFQLSWQNIFFSLIMSSWEFGIHEITFGRSLFDLRSLKCYQHEKHKMLLLYSFFFFLGNQYHE
jgi:hypothetical protein